jgi:hypothetical protein
MVPEILLNNNYRDDIYESIQNYITISKPYQTKRKVKFMEEKEEVQGDSSSVDA